MDSTCCVALLSALGLFCAVLLCALGLFCQISGKQTQPTLSDVSHVNSNMMMIFVLSKFCLLDIYFPCVLDYPITPPLDPWELVNVDLLQISDHICSSD